MKSASVPSLLFSAGLVVLAVACTKTITRIVPAESDAGAGDGGTKPVTMPSGDDDDDTTGDDAGKTSSSSSSSGDATPTAAACKKSSKNQDECAKCCAMVEPNGYQSYANIEKKCLCGPDLCLPDCKTSYCGATPKSPTPACQTCFNDNLQSCSDDLMTGCGADADCTKYNKCLNDATCPMKPTQ